MRPNALAGFFYGPFAENTSDESETASRGFQIFDLSEDDQIFLFDVFHVGDGLDDLFVVVFGLLVLSLCLE